MGKEESNKSILKDIEELRSDWKAMGDRYDSILTTALQIVKNKDDLDESDIGQLREILDVTDDLKKMMNQMYDECAEFRAALSSKDLVKSDKEGSLKKPDHNKD